MQIGIPIHLSLASFFFISLASPSVVPQGLNGTPLYTDLKAILMKLFHTQTNFISTGTVSGTMSCG